jgi:hypothetical protein
LVTLAGTNNTYTDTPPAMGPYVYGVSYYNSSGNGPTVNAPEIQVQGPAQYVPTSIPYAWVEINPNRPGGLPGTNTGLASDDQNLGPFPIGFDFSYYGGATFNSIRMCTNGFASFTSTATTFTNATIPTAAEPNNLLAIYWDDMLMTPVSGSGTAWYYYDAANSRFIAEWDSIAHYPSSITGDYFTFEIILYTDGTIDYMYKDVVPGTTAPFPQATVGVENATGTIGALATFNGSGPIEPVGLSGIHFGPSVAPPNVTITMTPVAPPIQIPLIGGSFDFNVSVANGESTSQTFDAWIMVQLPNMSWYGPALGPIELTLPASFTLARLRTQTVPGSAPQGNYLYEGRVGDYPGTIWDSDSFPFEKLAIGDGTPVPDWANSGESFEIGQVTVELPAAFALLGARPNPFNPTTTIGFALPEAAKVMLSVYDVSGRQVATLVNGWREAGSHQAVFDGSALASGVYLYRLSADNLSTVGKMVLMK